MSRPLAMNPPAEIREHAPLFDWAREQAAAAKELDAKIAAARKKHDATLAMLSESVEHGDVEAAKERLRDARKAALEDDDDVQRAKDAVKKARAAMRKTARDLIAAEKKAKGDVKALVQVKDETERGIVGALKAGRVPSDSDFVVERT